MVAKKLGLTYLIRLYTVIKNSYNVDIGNSYGMFQRQNIFIIEEEFKGKDRADKK